MNLLFLIATSIFLSHYHVYGLPTFKKALHGQDHDAVTGKMMTSDVIKIPLDFLKNDVEHAKDGIAGGGDDDSSEAPDDGDDQSNVHIQLDSNDSFCLFLPPRPGLDVAATETEGSPYCTSNSGHHQYPTLPSGLVITSHYESTPDYVQVTGRMDSDAYNLGSQDGGGQYDNRDVPGVSCNGYKFFVSLLEPDINRYCIRCCKNERDCPLGRSEYGCLRIVDGNYD